MTRRERYLADLAAILGTRPGWGRVAVACDLLAWPWAVDVYCADTEPMVVRSEWFTGLAARCLKPAAIPIVGLELLNQEQWLLTPVSSLPDFLAPVARGDRYELRVHTWTEAEALVGDGTLHREDIVLPQGAEGERWMVIGTLELEGWVRRLKEGTA